ncbi:MAG: PDZ domain-containing protein [Pyrinomonadaceae bacterium]
METETERAHQEKGGTTDTDACPSCHAALVRGMRFCRMCGYRHGEGMAEYVETVRFDGSHAATMPTFAPGNQTMTAPGGAPTTMISPGAPAQPLRRKSKRGRRKIIKWMALFLLILLIPVGAVGSKFLFGAIRDAARQRVSRLQAPSPPRSFFGAEEFGDVEGTAGALLEAALPGGPAERAGLIDGDIITKFDGTPVTGEDVMSDLLRQTPIGKTIEVVYLRDGETQSTMLTTISTRDYDADAFSSRERGLLGIQIDDTERVPVAGTKIHGVRLGDIYDNRPADLAGLKEGDIIVEFNDKPVRTTEGLGGYINAAKPGDTIPIAVHRDGQRIVIPVKMGRRN